jgi:hypothetical protein
MAVTVLSGPPGPRTLISGVTRLRGIVLLAAWLALIVTLGAAGAFVGRSGTPPIAIAIAVVAPLLLFFAPLRLSPSLRRWVLSLDLRVVAGIQAWRWAGFGFLALYAHHVLPAMFAIPAGLGDMAVGVTAPWIILGLLRQPDFPASRAFVRWNVLGIVDLVVAVSLGALGAMLPPRILGGISTAPMATLPLLLIPAFLVPIFIMLHAAALMQSRQLARGGT